MHRAAAGARRVTGRSLLPPGVTKEVRALLPIWAGSTGIVAVSGAIGGTRGHMVGLFAYALGALVLGAQSIGHEYAHRTLGVLLAQPWNRRRLYTIKLAVLAAMLLTLGAVAWVALRASPDAVRHLAGDGVAGYGSSVLWLTALCGLCLAPVLTMASRGALAGVVFTIVVPGSLLVLGDFIGVAVFWPLMIAILPVAALSGWRMFVRLEAIDGRGAELHLPRWGPDREHAISVERDAAVAPAAFWLLVKKEIRLQHMSFVVAGLGILAWVTISLGGQATQARTIPLEALVVLYIGLLSVLIGSLASAEERQLGTAEWGLLLPMAAWQQWAVKAGVALGLACLLSLAVQAAAWSLGSGSESIPDVARLWLRTTAVVLLVTSWSLYVSSLNASGVKAMIASVATLFGVVLLIQAGAWAWWSGLLRFFYYVQVSSGVSPEASSAVLVRMHHGAGRAWAILTPIVTAAGLIGILLWLGGVNHRSAERGPWRILQQAAVIAGFLAAAMLIYAAALFLSASQ